MQDIVVKIFAELPTATVENSRIQFRDKRRFEDVFQIDRASFLNSVYGCADRFWQRRSGSAFRIAEPD
jgi:hypothetical protein